MAEVIGTGAQYRVRDADPGWVHKELLTPAESREIITGWYQEGQVPASELEIDYPRLALDGCRKIKPLLKDHPPLREALGEPTIYDNGDYRQRKAQPIGALLLDGSPQEKRALVDAYVDLTLDLWQYGIAEVTFNCHINFGLTPGGRMILLDFGEIAPNKSDALKLVNTKHWLRAYSYRCLPGDVQSYYQNQLEQHLTLDALRNQWETALTLGAAPR